MAGAFRRGRDRDLGGAFQYSRRGLRLRRRGAYGIHRASGPRCQGLCRKVASLRSGGRRLAVRITIEYQIGALPRTPFPATREFAPVGSMSLDSRVAGLPYESSSFATSRGNERYEEKNRGVICFMYYSSNPPLVSGATTFPPQAGALWVLSNGDMPLQESMERFILSPGWGKVRRSRIRGSRVAANHQNAYHAI